MDILSVRQWTREYGDILNSLLGRHQALTDRGPTFRRHTGCQHGDTSAVFLLQSRMTTIVTRRAFSLGSLIEG